MQSPSTQPEAPPISGWRALLSVITEPGETFRRLGSRPPILPGYLLQMAVGLVVFAMTYQQIMEIVTQSMAMGAQQAGEAMAPGFLNVMQNVMLAFMIVGVLAEPWVSGLFVSLLALFVGQFHGGGVAFRSYYGMIGYARVPLALSTLLAGIYQAATGQMLNLSLGVLVPEGGSPYLLGLLSTFNPFTLWYYALLATGFAALFGRPARRGWALPAILWGGAIILGMVQMGLASQFGQFQM